jgi:diketogulonate reductase-like aldo/keto reductase
MIRSIADAAVLHNGVKMPWLGLGVLYLDEGGPVEQAVRWALEAG